MARRVKYKDLKAGDVILGYYQKDGTVQLWNAVKSEHASEGWEIKEILTRDRGASRVRHPRLGGASLGYYGADEVFLVASKEGQVDPEYPELGEVSY